MTGSSSSLPSGRPGEPPRTATSGDTARASLGSKEDVSFFVFVGGDDRLGDDKASFSIFIIPRSSLTGCLRDRRGGEVEAAGVLLATAARFPPCPPAPAPRRKNDLRGPWDDWLVARCVFGLCCCCCPSSPSSSLISWNELRLPIMFPELLRNDGETIGRCYRYPLVGSWCVFNSEMESKPARAGVA
jgi:hypothetical protein